MMPSDLLGNHLSMWDEKTEADIRIAQEFLARFRYKPEWYFSIVRKPEVGCARLSIQAMVIDSRKSGTPGLLFDDRPSFPITGEYNLPRLSEMNSPGTLFQDFLRSCIRHIELHESDEWFRVDGELPFDPHKGE